MFKELYENLPKEKELQALYKKIPARYKSLTDRRDFIVSGLLDKYKMSLKLTDLATDYVKSRSQDIAEKTLEASTPEAKAFKKIVDRMLRDMEYVQDYMKDKGYKKSASLVDDAFYKGYDYIYDFQDKELGGH